MKIFFWCGIVLKILFKNRHKFSFSICFFSVCQPVIKTQMIFFQEFSKNAESNFFFWRKWDIFQNTKTSRFDRKGNPTNVPILQICKYSLAPRMIVKSNNSPPRKNCICEFLIVKFFFSRITNVEWINESKPIIVALHIFLCVACEFFLAFVSAPYTKYKVYIFLFSLLFHSFSIKVWCLAIKSGNDFLN